MSKQYFSVQLTQSGISREEEEIKGSYLPALVCSAVVRVVFGDVGIDTTESQLLVWGRGNGLDNQLCIGIRWLGLILVKGKTSLNKHASNYHTVPFSKVKY